ncbi:Hypothetical protein PAS_chr2-1_0614 [Komagataella phaffii GS115]|uniref:Uncharacterized protein n=2 Tax=Komagataella phaffii TaxID=460519 RepID=C4R180_KOMPG|nr:Hypothetical protein PAS_chr2-1_0614 [Komagataella phaffii GS115]CAY69254.1 Hypothetical protein PAS_chr2-1_0614 [Komagataella phaffii GS115]
MVLGCYFLPIQKRSNWSHPCSPLWQEVEMSGKKTLPKEVIQRGRYIQLIIFGLPLVILPGYELYQRIFNGKERKIQQGEILSDGTLREFSEYEKYEVHKNSWLTRIFGER